jgi:hypothetical protein
MRLLPKIQFVKFVEYKIRQNPSEHPRRHFSDNGHFDLIVWYHDSSFEKIMGFQLGFKVNPFDTDKEYFLSHWPDMESTSSFELSKTAETEHSYAAPKIIQQTDEPPPPTFIKKLDLIADSLPRELKHYLEKFVRQLRAPR